MDGNQTERKSISLTKESDEARPKVREAYPVYSHDTSQDVLERQEYRNTPPQPEYQHSEPEMQQTPSDDLGRYYAYDTNINENNIPAPAPQVTQPPVQQETKYCKFCGKKIPFDSLVCPYCGKQLESRAVNRNAGMVQAQQNMQPVPAGESSLSKSTALLLTLLGFIGVGGIQRLYAGKVLSGLIYLFTGGVCGIGTIVDLILIASGSFSDSNGRLIKK